MPLSLSFFPLLPLSSSEAEPHRLPRPPPPAQVKTTLKSERVKAAPRRRFTSRQRTSRFFGVGSSNSKYKWLVLLGA